MCVILSGNTRVYIFWRDMPFFSINVKPVMTIDKKSEFFFTLAISSNPFSYGVYNK